MKQLTEAQEIIRNCWRAVGVELTEEDWLDMEDADEH